MSEEKPKIIVDEEIDDKFNELLKKEGAAVRREKMKLSEARKVLSLLIDDGKLNPNDQFFKVRYFIEEEYNRLADISRRIIERTKNKDFQEIIDSEGWNIAREKIEWNSVRDILDWLLDEKMVNTDEKLSDVLKIIDDEFKRIEPV